MTDFGELADLTAADDPLSWAHDEMRFVAGGDTASVFRHPSDPDLVLRVTDYPDGWFGYAMSLADILADDMAPPEIVEAVGRHAPGVRAMRAFGPDDGYLGAICERLESVEGAALDLVASARAVILTPFPPCMDSDEPDALARHGRAWAAEAVGRGSLTEAEAERLLASQPGLLGLAQAIPGRVTDLRDSNWMMRGPHLVLHDPIRAMTRRDHVEFVSRFGSGRGHAPVR